MLYGQEPQLLMISRNNDDETDNSSDSMDSITPQELRPPIIAGLTLDHNNSWYYNEGQNAKQCTYDEPHPHAPATDPLQARPSYNTVSTKIYKSGA